MQTASTKRRNTRQNLFSFGNIKGRNTTSPCADKYRILTEPTNAMPYRRPREMHNPLQEIGHQQLAQNSALKTPSFFHAKQRGRERIGTDLYESDTDRYQSRYSELSIDRGRYSYNPSIQQISQKYGFRQKHQVEDYNPREMAMRSMSQQKFKNEYQKYEPQAKIESKMDHMSRQYTLYDHKLKQYKPNSQYSERESDPQAMLNSINDLSAKINEKMKCLLSQCDDSYNY